MTGNREMNDMIDLVKCTIADLFYEAVENYGKKAALIWQDEVYSWQDLDRLSDLAAMQLKEDGLKKGAHIGLWDENSAAWIVNFLAIQKAGAVAVLLNSGYRFRELAQAMRISEMDWLCYGQTAALRSEPDLIRSLAGKAGTRFRGCTDIRETFDRLKTKRDGAMEVEKQESEENPDATSCQPGRYLEAACMLFTTGTTSEPKCVVHNHYSLVNNAIHSACRIHMDSHDRICLSQPVFHAFALCSSLLGAIYSGASLIVLSCFSSDRILNCVQQYQCTILNGVPTNFLCMMTSPGFSRFKTNSLRLITIGGANISAGQLHEVRRSFPTAHVVRNYGLTEGCNLCNSEYSDSNVAVARCVGVPYPHIELTIRDPESGEPMPAGSVGEITVRGYNVMQGYYSAGGSCGAPSTVIDEEGWLHTGDLGLMDEHGYVSIAGRIKDIIIRGGENINPTEVGREILIYEPILDALVIGVPNPLLGEEVVGCVTLDIPEDYSEEELRGLLKYRISKYKIPSQIFVYEAFPLKANGKVDMETLKKDAYLKAIEKHRGEERYKHLVFEDVPKL